ncbi:54S ribosomal protein L6 mitochondrial [Ophidiomyces ophidiicola]|nr:54S ribosomal protein L6 mitochondrial [Ophidiomyces ophidiicola]KAI1991568.1 54S ribosomal protein L6 mitochondrial [Ophidiomyces ophidiicola]KAI1993476.1 54S ribosomal protein L6 mitochondrial [Ophidiomyces ophidiicola]KAI1997612.1 54S ribosomal protein L6 mitochondrial [Ophidiomyces ophidiicola]
MSGSIARHSYRRFLRETIRSSPPPAFLIPAFSLPQQSQKFSTSSSRESRIGAAPIAVPPEVSLKFVKLPKSQSIAKSRAVDVPTMGVEVSGPLGKMTLNIPSFCILDFDPESKKANFGVTNIDDKHQKSMWGACFINIMPMTTGYVIADRLLLYKGTTRQHLKNYILGVSEGHICILKLVGVGFRAIIEPTAITVSPEFPGQQFVSLKVGFAHPVELGIPQGVKASTPQPTTILLEGVDKEVVTQFAANIRKWRPPEPYKGKGIFVNGETIKLKAKKIK